MNNQGQSQHGWTVVLRRRPVRIVGGRQEGGYTNAYEIICCDCGDNPDLDYRQVSPALQRIRGPYPLMEGVAAYEKHVGRHQSRPAIHPSGRPIAHQRQMTGWLTAQDAPTSMPKARPAKNLARQSWNTT